MSSPHEYFRGGNSFAHCNPPTAALIDNCIITLISDEMSAQNQQFSKQIHFQSS